MPFRPLQIQGIKPDCFLLNFSLLTGRRACSHVLDRDTNVPNDTFSQTFE